MIAFEHDFTVQNDMGGIIKPIILCDHCHQRIMADGNTLWIQPEDLPRKPKVIIKPLIFHTHKHCNYAFEAAYEREHGLVLFYSDEIDNYLAQLTNNVVTIREKDARRLFDLVKRLAKEARKVHP